MAVVKRATLEICIIFQGDNMILLHISEKPQNKSAKQTNQNGPNKPDNTWVHEIFQGTLTNETRCLNCETVSIMSIYCAGITVYKFALSHS